MFLGQVTPPLCSRSCQCLYPLGNQHCSRTLTACLPLQKGTLWLAEWAWLVGRAGRGGWGLISRAMLKQWPIGVGGKLAQFLGPQCSALFCSLLETNPLITPLLTFLSCCYHNPTPSLGFLVTKSLPCGLILEKPKLGHSLMLSFFICHMEIIMPSLNNCCKK